MSNLSLESSLSCEFCNVRVEAMLRCSSCKLFFYCSEKCQRADWKTHKYLCSCHKTASKDNKFSALPASIRLEIITTRLVLSAFSDKSHIPISLPEAFIADLPRLATHWFTLAVVVQSLGTRDIFAFFDFDWDTDRMLLDVRVAALFSYWRSSWRPLLEESRRRDECPFKQLVILQNMDYTRFLNVPSSGSDQKKSKTSACWRIRFSDCSLMQTSVEVRSLYSQFYYELSYELEQISLKLTSPTWKQQISQRMEWQQWVSNNKNNSHEVDSDENDEEIERKDSLLDLTALTSSQVLGVLSIHSFYCLLNAAAASDHVLSVSKVSEILFRRGFFPKSPLRVLLTSKVRLEPCLLLLAIVTNRFLAELNEHGLGNSPNGSVSESTMLIDLKLCGTSNHSSPESKSSTHNCKWCNWTWDTSKLSRFTLCLLFLVRVLPLKHATSWKEAETLRKWIYPLSQHALRHGIDWLRVESSALVKSKTLSENESTLSVEAPSLDTNSTISHSSSVIVPTASPVVLQNYLNDSSRSDFFTTYTHFVCICSEVSDLQAVINIPEYWCIALSLRYDFWTLFDMSMYLVFPDSTTNSIFSRLARPKSSDKKLSEAELTKSFNYEALVESFPVWILDNIPPLPLYQLDTVRFESFEMLPVDKELFSSIKCSASESEDDFFPCEPRDASTYVDSLPPNPFVLSDSNEKLNEHKPCLFSAALKYKVPLMWARRAALHPDAGYEVTEVLLTFFVDLLHRESCPNNDSAPAERLMQDLLKKVPRDNLPFTSCGCSLFPSREHKYLKPDLKCNIMECFRVVLYFLFHTNSREALEFNSSKVVVLSEIDTIDSSFFVGAPCSSLLETITNVVKTIFKGQPDLVVPYGACLQRLCSSYEFELDYQYAHGCKEATSNTNEFALRQRLIFLPAALLRAGPMTLDLLRRLGWELLCEARFCAIGLHISPVLAIHCCLLHSLLRPAAWNAYIVAEKIHLQQLPATEVVQSALQHDILLLQLSSKTLSVEKQAEQFELLQRGIFEIIISIRSELVKLDQMWVSGELENLILDNQKAKQAYTSAEEYRSMMGFALELCDYSESVAMKQAVSELSKDRLAKIRERKVRITEDLLSWNSPHSSLSVLDQPLSISERKNLAILKQYLDSENIDQESDEDCETVTDPNLGEEIEKKVSPDDSIDELVSMKVAEPIYDLKRDDNLKLDTAKEQQLAAVELSRLLNEIEIVHATQNSLKKTIIEMENTRIQLSKQVEQTRQQHLNLANSQKSQLKSLLQQEKQLNTTKAKQEAEREQWLEESKNTQNQIMKETQLLQDEKLKNESKREMSMAAFKNEEEQVQLLNASVKTMRESIKVQQDGVKKLQEQQKQLQSEFKHREESLKVREKALNSTQSVDESFSKAFLQKQEKLQSTYSKMHDEFEQERQNFAKEKLKWESEQEKLEMELDERFLSLEILESQVKSQGVVLEEESLSIKEQIDTVVFQCNNVKTEREMLHRQRIQLADWFRQQQNQSSSVIASSERAGPT